MTQDQKNSMMEKMSSAINLDQGQELNDTPQVSQSSGKIMQRWVKFIKIHQQVN